MADHPQLKWKDAVLTVLRESPNTSMHYVDIADAIAEQGLRTSLGATPANSVYTTLTGAAAGSVRKVGKGLFALADQPRDVQQDNPDDATVEKASDAAVLSPIGSLDADTPQSGMVSAYGMYWQRDAVDWATVPKLLGRENPHSTAVDFSAQSGVYVLYDRERVVYAGQVGSRSPEEPLSNKLGGRLYEHTRDRLTTRWDRFSWFGVRPVTSDGELVDVTGRLFTAREAINTFEAVMIEVLEAPLNRQRGRWAGAVEYIQA